MKTKTMIALLLGLGISAGSIALAQEEMPEQAVSDAGVEAVREAQAMPAPSTKTETLEKALQRIAREKKWNIGVLDADHDDRYITIVTEVVNTKDPANDPDFLIKREAAFRRAYLHAKAEIIGVFNTEMSASDQLFIPGTDINAEFDKDLKAIEANLVEEKENLAKILDRYNRAEAAELRGTTFSDRMDDLLVAVIKKLDDTYDADAKDEKVKAQLAEAKKNLEEQKAKIKQLKEQAELLSGSLGQKQTSEAKTVSSMALFGATVAMTAEKFENQSYQVAIVVIWSRALERAARAIVNGEPYKVAPKQNGMSINDWIETRDLSTLAGPLTFLDKDGNRWFLGVSARECNDSMGSVAQRRAKGIAEQFAKSAAVFSVMGDVKAQTAALSIAQTYVDNNTQEERDKVAESLDEKISQSLEKVTVRGLQKLTSDIVEHPWSHHDMYVVIYAIDANSAKAALENETINVETKKEQERHQTVERGRNAANQAAIEAAKNRPEDFNKGFSEQNQALNQERQKRDAEKNASSGSKIQPINSTPTTKPTEKKESTQGISIGNADVSDDF